MMWELWETQCNHIISRDTSSVISLQIQVIILFALPHTHSSFLLELCLNSVATENTGYPKIAKNHQITDSDSPLILILRKSCSLTYRALTASFAGRTWNWFPIAFCPLHCCRRTHIGGRVIFLIGWKTKQIRVTIWRFDQILFDQIK